MGNDINSNRVSFKEFVKKNNLKTQNSESYGRKTVSVFGANADKIPDNFKDLPKGEVVFYGKTKGSRFKTAIVNELTFILNKSPSNVQTAIFT